MDNRYDVIVVGGGPAGLTAAIYAARGELKTMILEYDAPGGKLVKTAEIANWPGITKSTGVDLALSMYNHAISLNVEYNYGEVVALKVQQNYHELVCADGNSYQGKAVIIATGTKERLMNIPNEKEMIGQGLSFCAVCDAAFFKGEDVVVVGGGNSALEEALYLSSLVNKLYLVIRRDEFRADKKVVARVLASTKIEIIYKHLPTAVISSDNRVSGLEITSVETDQRRILPVKGIFPYIGADPATAFVKDLAITNEQGFLVVDQQMATTVPGIYGAGDVCAKQLRQVVTAASDGAIAAVSVIHYLK